MPRNRLISGTLDVEVFHVQGVGFDELAAQAGLEPAQLALSWVLAQGDHVHAIPGTTNIDHMRENFAASDVAARDEVLAEAAGRINQRTVTVDCEGGAGWRVPFAMLRHVMDI